MQECNTNTKLNILHICDYEGSYDDLTRFISYPGQIVNAPIEVMVSHLASKIANDYLNVRRWVDCIEKEQF